MKDLVLRTSQGNYLCQAPFLRATEPSSTFAQGLASGGTAKLLRENGISVTEVADYTKSPEILG